MCQKSQCHEHRCLVSSLCWSPAQLSYEDLWWNWSRDSVIGTEPSRSASKPARRKKSAASTGALRPTSLTSCRCSCADSHSTSAAIATTPPSMQSQRGQRCMLLLTQLGLAATLHGSGPSYLPLSPTATTDAQLVSGGSSRAAGGGHLIAVITYHLGHEPASSDGGAGHGRDLGHAVPVRRQHHELLQQARRLRLLWHTQPVAKGPAFCVAALPTSQDHLSVY